MKPIGHRTVTDASVMQFGCLTGDYSRMHFDLDFGTTSGMGGPIAHGLLSAAWSLGALSQHAPGRLAIGQSDAFISRYRVRYRRPVQVGDLFALRWNEADAGDASRLDTEFEILNQHDEITCTGSLSTEWAESTEALARSRKQPALLEIGAWPPGSMPQPLFADDMIAFGPRGESIGRTVTEADVVGYASFAGELNPVHLNAAYASASIFGQRIAPPMWTFCVAFADHLRDLLSVEMPSQGFAGHLGDSWRVVAPVHIGDTLRTRHCPVSFTPSKSLPGMGIVEFALQVVNQRDEIVQEGRVVMMIPTRRGA